MTRPRELPSPTDSSYPLTPPGWRETGRRTIGPFATHVTWERPDGGTSSWSSRVHRKHASKLSRPERSGVWWAPRRASWWIGVLFAIGSTCFFVGPFPGTVYFNVSTFHALRAGLDASSYDRLVWKPDALGSVCFLVSGYLAYAEVCGHAFWTRKRTLEWKIAAVNLVGCVAFGLSAVASLWLPSSGGVLALAASNWFTALGGLCFLVGAILLLPESAAVETVESGGAALYAHT